MLSSHHTLTNITTPAQINKNNKMTLSSNVQRQCFSASKEYVDLGGSFLIDPLERNYQQQYASLYFTRLMALQPWVTKNAERKWANLNPTWVPKVLDVEMGKLSVLIGTVYCDMPMKPNVLKDLAEENSLTVPPTTDSYCSKEAESLDFYDLEDMSGRIRLAFADDGKMVEANRLLLTGVVLAVLGQEDKSGVFIVQDFCSAFDLEHVDLSPQNDDNREDSLDPVWIGFVSGIRLGSGNEFFAGYNGPASLDDDAQGQKSLALELLADLISGELSEEMSDELTSLQHFVILGDSIAAPPPINNVLKPKLKENAGKSVSDLSVRPVQEFDSFLSSIAPSISIDLLPGACDPTTYALPQQPLQRFLFPQSSDFGSLQLRTNPHRFKFGECDIFLGSGQNIQDSKRYQRKEGINDEASINPSISSSSSSVTGSIASSTIQISIDTLRWGHWSPSCPDTMTVFPFSSRDPFLLVPNKASDADTKILPNIMVAGNQALYESALVKDAGSQGNNCLIVHVPRFDLDPSIVLVDVANLKSKILRFKVDVN